MRRFGRPLQTARQLPATAIAVAQMPPAKLTGVASKLTTSVSADAPPTALG
jgi:hypothetical protein